MICDQPGCSVVYMSFLLSPVICGPRSPFLMAIWLPWFLFHQCMCTDYGIYAKNAQTKYLWRSRDCLLLCLAVWVDVFVCIRSSLHSVRFGQLLRCAHKCIVKIMKVYIERKNMQVELIRFRKKYRLYWRWKLWSGNILSRQTCWIRNWACCYPWYMCRHCSEEGAPDVSGHDHFDTLF